MGYVFQSTAGLKTQDRATAAEAIADVEASGSGSVTKFRTEPNLPFCLPEVVYRSLALWTYDDGKWQQRSIFGGNATAIGESKPE